MLNATSIALCAIEVKWTLPDHPPNNTAAPAYILIEASLSGSTEWTEIGYSTVNTTESKMNFPLIGVFNGTNTVNELYLRARSGNDIGNIGVGEYYTENTTFSFFSEGTHIIKTIACDKIMPRMSACSSLMCFSWDTAIVALAYFEQSSVTVHGGSLQPAHLIGREGKH